METVAAVELVSRANDKEFLPKDYKGRLFLINRTVFRVERIGNYLNIWYEDGGYSAYKPQNWS